MYVARKIHFQVKQGFYTTLFLLFLSRFHLKYTETNKKINSNPPKLYLSLCRTKKGSFIRTAAVRILSPRTLQVVTDVALSAKGNLSSLCSLLVRVDFVHLVWAAYSSPGRIGFELGS